MTPTDDVLDEALERLHAWGPEWRGRLSNHGPMVVESMVARGHAEQVEPWLDGYARILEPPRRPRQRIADDDWQAALGDPERLSDWISFFDDRVAEAPWRDVLATWWPRLLPGLAASATHSVIRLGHSVRALRERGESPARRDELSASLAYWAGRWLPVTGAVSGHGATEPAAALASLPALGHDGSFPDLLDQLAANPSWPSCARVALTDDPAAAQRLLQDLVVGAGRHYRTHGHGEPIMLVHAVTAPNAVLRLLPSVPQQMWPQSLHAAWTAAAAVTTIYNPTSDDPVPLVSVAASPADMFARAVDHGDEHVIKLADAILDAYSWNPDHELVAAGLRASMLIEREGP